MVRPSSLLNYTLFVLRVKPYSSQRDALRKKVSRERVRAELEGMFNDAPFLCSGLHTVLFLMWSLIRPSMLLHCIKRALPSVGSYRACSRCVLGVGCRRTVAHAKAQTLLWERAVAEPCIPGSTVGTL